MNQLKGSGHAPTQSLIIGTDPHPSTNSSEILSKDEDMAPRSNDNDSNSNGNGGSGASAPFHNRSTTTRGGRSNHDNANNKQKQKHSIYYQPSVHQFSCRGAFHLTQNDPKNKKTKKEQDEPTLVEGTDDLEALINSMFICNGIQTKLRHVTDYPLARSKDEAIGWFGGVGGSPMMGGDPNNATSPAGGSNNGQEQAALDNSSQDASNIDSSNKNNSEEGGDDALMEAVDITPESTFSSYGTTQVNLLTIQEIPVVTQEADPNSRNSVMADPFRGFGSIAPSGMLNPFGSLFGGFFGGGGPGGMVDPWSQHPGEETSDNSGWMPPRGATASRSVSSSTRMDRDENGKRVVTTVTKTTTVDSEGQRRMETVTTERHVDDGGRVETKKVVQTEGDENKKKQQKQGSSNMNSKDASDKQEGGEMATKANRSPQPLGHPMFPHSPFHQPPAIVLQASEPTKPAEVAVIATDNLLGVAISDSVTDDPDSAVPQSKKAPSSSSRNKNSSNSGNTSTENNQIGWRKTEYLFRLGRFIPPFMIVNKYYQDKEAEEKRRNEMKREYTEMRDRMKKNRWDKSASKNGDDDKSEESNSDSKGTINNTTTETPISNSLSNVSSRTEYYLQRIYVQMNKNWNMMGILANEMIQPDFPKKVQVSGQKILDNMGPTAERTGKLMKDVWDMWLGSLNDGWNGSNGGEDGGGRRR